jgi:hypothetical protein
MPRTSAANRIISWGVWGGGVMFSLFTRKGIREAKVMFNNKKTTIMPE